MVMASSTPPPPLPDDPYSEKEWESADVRILNSPLVNEYMSITGEEPFYRRVPNNERRVKLVASKMLQGDDTPVLTIMGHERTTKNSTQGRRGWDDINKILKDFHKQLEPCPGLHSVIGNAMKKLPTHRGILDAAAIAGKIAKVHESGRPKVDPSMMRALVPHLIEAWDILGRLVNDGKKITLDETSEWFPQFPSNKNSGHPYNMPIPKERFVSQDWVNWRSDIRYLLNKEVLSIDDIDHAPRLKANANISWYMAGSRSPDRLIYMTQLFRKIMGAFMNANLIANCGGGKSYISWEPPEDIASRTRKRMSSAMSQAFVDFRGYDTTWGVELCEVLLEAYLESSFAANNKELRNAVWYFLLEITQPSTLQIGETRAVNIRPSLWSGISGTQLFGSVVHYAVDMLVHAEVDLGYLGGDYLSDDGKFESDLDYEELRKKIFEDYARIAEGLGMELHPEKTFVTDPSNTCTVGMRNGEEVEFEDTGPYLQYLMGSSYLMGNVPRRIWSLYEMERDTSMVAISATVKAHAPGLRRADRKNTIAQEFFELYRSAAIVQTLGPDCPITDHIDVWISDTFPDFHDRILEFTDKADDQLWESPITHAGGTIEGRQTTASVMERWQQLSVEPVEWEPSWDY